MDEKRIVDLTLERRCFFKLKAELTEEDFERIESYIQWGEHGADIMYVMKADPNMEPDRWDDEVEDIAENFADYPLVKNTDDGI